MKLEILQEQLVGGLTTALKAVAVRAQLPVLSHVLLEAEADGLVLSATDLELGVKVKVAAKVTEPGKTTIPAKMCFEFVNSLAPGKLTLETDGEAVKIASGAYKASFQAITAEEFPKLPEFTKKELLCEVKLSEVARGIDEVVFASAKDGLRPVLTGIMVEAAKDLKLVATDGFRLAIAKVAITGEAAKELSLLIPSRAMAEVARMGGEETAKVGYLESSHQVLFEAGPTMLVTQILDGNYPDYAKIMPKEFSTEVNISKGEILAAVKAAYIFARDNSNMMRWKIESKGLSVTASSPERGECAVEVAAAVDGEGGEIVFNAKFILDYLSIMSGEEVWFGMSGNLAAAEFRDPKKPGNLYVVMPINA